MSSLKQFRRLGAEAVFLVWTDGHQGPIRLTTLRDQCPCAECAGETVLLRQYDPPTPDKEAPGRYELQSAEAVGNYAMKCVWGDGHSNGLYTWELLRSLCECEQCVADRLRNRTGERR